VDKSHVLFVLPIEARLPGSAPLTSVGEQVYLAFAILIGVASGPIQSASRTLLARLSPPDKTTEFSGFFSFSGKISSFAAPFLIAVHHNRYRQPTARHWNERFLSRRGTAPAAAGESAQMTWAAPDLRQRH